MALSAKLEMRQSQSLVMTPQLQQAIKLLQLSNLELNDFVASEMEKNPLLERGDDGSSPEVTGTSETRAASAEEPLSGLDQRSEADTAKDFLAEDRAAVDRTGDLDTDYDNIDPDRSKGDSSTMPSDSGWASLKQSSGSSVDDPEFNLEAFATPPQTLHEHLTEQLGLAIADPIRRMIAVNLIDLVDEAGYVRGSLEQVATQLGAPLSLVEATLTDLQTFDPPGVFARNLGECLALQLKELDRFDPMMAALIANLQLLAEHNLPALRRACNCDETELNDMISELRQLNPKPGLRFGTTQVQPVVPDVLVRLRNDGGWTVELNAETLPKVLVNQHYYTTVTKTARQEKDKSYLQNCLQTANWLVKSLDQRARTIMKVAEEIVRQQDAFLTHGIQHLRPLNLKTVADAISMHESTVSRVTSNKYIETPRGIFELKYFFTSSIQAAGGGEAYSSEAVRFRIKVLIDAENAERVLSDDQIVAKLQSDGIDIARRTVAKYREGMHIASSVQRRREKKLTERARAGAA